MKIYITRHGETIWNREGRIQGWHDSNLTEKGIENAKKLGKRLKHINFDCIYSSPSGRALNTAKYIRGEKDTKIIVKESLKEMGFGSWEGIEHSKVGELYPIQQYNCWNKPHLYEPIDGEKFTEVIDRARQVIDEVIYDNTCENILIVSHAALIKAIYAIIKSYSLEDFWSSPFLDGTSLTILEIKNGIISIVLEADISHLS